MERKRHVGVRKRAEQLGQERFLPDAEELTFELVRARKAEPLQLGDQVLSGPHLRRSPAEAKDGLAKKRHNFETSRLKSSSRHLSPQPAPASEPGLLSFSFSFECHGTC